MIATLDHRNHPALHEMEIDPETREPSPGRQYFGSRTVALSNGGTQVFTMRATASCDYVAFNLKIAYEIDGERQEPRIVTNRGRPFEITGFSQQPPGVGSYQQVYDVQDDHSLGPAADPRHYDLGNVGSCEPA